MIGKKLSTINISNAFHAGFITSLIFTAAMIIPALFLTNKLEAKSKSVLSSNASN
jgi:hypothetical protein